MESVLWGSYGERNLFLDFMSFSLDQQVTENQILNYSIYFYVVVAIQIRRGEAVCSPFDCDNYIKVNTRI